MMKNEVSPFARMCLAIDGIIRFARDTDLISQSEFDRIHNAVWNIAVERNHSAPAEADHEPA